MKIEPFKSLEDIPLNLTVESLIERLGKPQKKEVNRVNLTEFHYGDRIWRFSDSTDLNEVTVYAPAVSIDQIETPFEGLKKRIKEDDSCAFERYGFVISPKYGVAFDPVHAPWLTVLTTNGLLKWEEI
jgi:hypothetical protein